MKKLIISLIFITILTQVFGQNRQNSRVKGFESNYNNQSPELIDVDPGNIKDLNGDFITEVKEENQFKIDNFNNSRLELSGGFTDIIPVRYDERELPLAIYIKKDRANDGADQSVKDRAYNILGNSHVKNMMRIVNERDFVIESAVTDELGITHIKMNQMFRKRLIFGGQIYLHIYNNIDYNFINGKWFSDPSFSIEQRSEKKDKNRYDFLLKSSGIEEIIRNDLESGDIHMREDHGVAKLIQSEEEITIEEMYLPDEVSGDFKPVYVAKVAPNSMHRYKYLIDAQAGEIIRKQTEHCSLIPEGRMLSPLGGVKTTAKDLTGTNREINVYEKNGQYYMVDISRSMFNASKSSLPDDPVGVIITLDAKNTNPNSSAFNNSLDHVKSSNNSWNAGAVSAHYNSSFAYEYYLNKFSRNSIDGKGGNVISIINVTDENSQSMDNAFWAGTAMFYGNGKQVFKSPLQKSLDVSGHELTHGVIQNSANLEYYDEPGAVNESYADVFGVMMDRDDWKLGEDVVSTQYFPTGALRDMSNPHNGGAGSNGYQPAHYDEKYTGEEDNRGVHINSGIPNLAFFKFASAVGKEKAEQVYYRALVHYLTKSSDFKDLRVAIENSAADLYGNDVKNAASTAFAAVGIGGSGGSGSSHQQDLKTNPGNDYVICTDEDYGALYLLDGNGTLLKNPLSNTDVLSKPSITDDGKHVVFVGTDKKIHYIKMDWPSGNGTEEIISNQAIWRTAAISKDGSKIAALKDEVENKVHVWSYLLQKWQEFELYNPSTAQGVELGTVLYADVLEFDYSGEWIMYDCKNSLSSGGFFDIEYWDIGFLNVWNNKSKTFTQGRVEKLFSGLPDDVSIGNPVFSKNSPYIIGFDYKSSSEYYLLGYNIETGDLGTIFSNNDWSSPSYSKDDRKVIFDYDDGTANIGIVDVDNTKINQVVNTAKYFIEGGRWGRWFSNGVRSLTTAVSELPGEIATETSIYPNPAASLINFESKDFTTQAFVTVFDILGNKLYSRNHNFIGGKATIDVSFALNGNYIVKVTDGKKLFTEKLMILRK
ncbi:MAG: M4 family metallopeptidase [Deltaproteobacteria bacterium]